MFRMLSCTVLLMATFACSAADAAPSGEALTVLSSGGIMGAIREVAPAYEKKFGVKLNVVAAPSMGETPQAVPNRLARGEPADVVLMVGSALDKLVDHGQADKASRVDLGKSFIAMAVRKGEPKPDISTLQGLRTALLDSKSVAYSDSASGVYLSKTLFPRMQLGTAFDAKAHMIPAEPVGAVVARGQAQIGFQQLSELKPVKGIDIVGLIPAQAQKMTMYSGAIVSKSPHHAAAQALLDYLASPQADAAIEDSGLKPLIHNAG
ncbi:ABC transporter substrate-binding protein [Pseudomonas sp. SWI6]|uniref:Substrate-binding domain-containing protein n=1 Tax=Pseudomonas taiwanensis TaxID=470150 RepID=A0ABR6V1S6_9PSED|nr:MULTISPECIES: substrate-binding domain-containing protein [Pseudomonas]AGZ35610.1 extracellular solute-binding protein [Pseudomonas sp. VLB120]AVD82935.1 ABC transporter substrate-binding protein [Pseudomonas sp. SWI6]AVD89896.1 ABC transporter substrate-binding protein [Pseudomonas sp. SWI44]MBC3474438.1 substrate-binding domain-containing protein [Pseudomonas taiwanensis]MBC3489628.1 substrate-binding domain-containing protein [Pseudomonas taiwanensis]